MIGKVQITSEPSWADLLKQRDELVRALQPFAAWARGLAEVEQPDAFEYRRLDNEGRQMSGEVLADDFARVLTALANIGAP